MLVHVGATATVVMKFQLAKKWYSSLLYFNNSIIISNNYNFKDATGCDHPCSGDNTQMCGGNAYRTSVYRSGTLLINNKQYKKTKKTK